MKLREKQVSSDVRDAGEVAFGFLALGILAAVGTLLLTVGIFDLMARDPTRNMFVTAWLVTWSFSMIPVLKRYKRATRSWSGERRGGNMLFLVEFITSIASLGASMFISNANGDTVRAAQIRMSGFLFLLICSHVATYALLGYRPQMKEWFVWCALGCALVLEIRRNA